MSEEEERERERPHGRERRGLFPVGSGAADAPRHARHRSKSARLRNDPTLSLPPPFPPPSWPRRQPERDACWMGRESGTRREKGRGGPTGKKGLSPQVRGVAKSGGERLGSGPTERRGGAGVDGHLVASERRERERDTSPESPVLFERGAAATYPSSAQDLGCGSAPHHHHSAQAPSLALLCSLLPLALPAPPPRPLARPPASLLPATAPPPPPSPPPAPGGCTITQHTNPSTYCPALPRRSTPAQQVGTLLSDEKPNASPVSASRASERPLESRLLLNVNLVDGESGARTGS